MHLPSLRAIWMEMNSSLSDPAFLASAPVRLYHHLPLSLSPDDGPWGWRGFWFIGNGGPRTGDRKYNQAARFWAKIFGLNFAVRRCHRHSHGVSIRDQLVRLFPVCRRGDRADAGDGGHVRLFPGKRIHRRVHLGRKAARSAQPFSRRRRRCAGKLAFRLFYFGDEFFHAASGRLPDHARWLAGHRQCQRLLVESVGLDPIRA